MFIAPHSFQAYVKQIDVFFDFYHRAMRFMIRSMESFQIQVWNIETNILGVMKA